MRCLLCLFVMLSALLSAETHAADEYIQPTETALMQTLLRFDALDLTNDIVIDDYAKTAECDLFSVFRDDDFKWNKIRDGLRNKIKSETVTYPTSYVVKGYIKLDRYDFDTKTFKIASDSPMLGINAFRLMDAFDRRCGKTIKVLPQIYVAVIENRVNIPGFIMSESDAQAMLNRLQKDGNGTRQILAKFNLRIIDVPKVKLDYSNVASWYEENVFVGKSNVVNMQAKLDSVEFFEDEAMKRRFFVYRP